MLQADKFFLRPLHESDLPHVNCILQQLSTFKPSDSTMSAAFDKLSKIDHYACVCVSPEGKVVGVGFVYYLLKIRGGLVGKIEDLAVSTEYHRNGLGTKIIEHLVSVALSYGCYAVSLDCKPSTKSFYLDRGFEEFGLTMRYRTILSC